MKQYSVHSPQSSIRNSVIIFLGVLILYACGPQPKMMTVTFFTEGSCEECANYIQEAATQINGVDSAAWNLKKNMTFVRFDANKTHIDSIQKAIANIGFETQFFPSNPTTKAKLPTCCTMPLKVGQ